MTLTSSLTFCVVLTLMVTTGTASGVTGQTCFMKGDPHIRSFTASIHDLLPYPCLALMAHLKYGTTSGDVHVKVYASSGLSTIGGRYFVDYVKVVVNNNTGGYEAIFESDSSIIMVASGVSSAWLESGSFPSHVKVVKTFDTVQKLATLRLGKAGSTLFNVEVQFFAGNSTDHRGVTIKAQKSAGTTSVLYFPDCMCSTFDDYSGTSAINGSFTDDTKLLLAALGQGADQDNDVCQNATNIYMNCGSTKQEAAAYCKRYLEHNKAKSLEDPSKGGTGGDAMAAFTVCLEDKCGHSLGSDGCVQDEDCVASDVCVSGVCEPKSFIIFTDRSNQNIVKMDLWDPQSYTTCFHVEGFSRIWGIGYDPVQDTAYWTNIFNFLPIGRVRLNGSNPETFLPAIASPGISVDHLSRLVLIVDNTAGSIKIVTIDRAHTKTVITGLNSPWDIIADIGDGKLYWTETSNPRIGQMNYDGSNMMTVSAPSQTPYSLALDKPGRRLFWGDFYTPNVHWVSLDNFNQMETINPSPGISMFSLAVFQGYIYMGDYSGLTRIPFSGGTPEPFGPLSVTIMSIHVHVTGAGPQANGCSDGNHGCSHICVPLPGLNHQCLCQDGMTLHGDLHSCV